MKCTVIGCPTNIGNDLTVSFHSFPKGGNLRKLWVKFCGQKVEKNSKICSDHFLTEDYENSLKFELGFCKSRKLKKGAVPTIYPTDVKHINGMQKTQRRERKKIINCDTKASTTKVGWINEELFDYRDKATQENCNNNNNDNAVQSPSTSPTETNDAAATFSTTKCIQTENDDTVPRIFIPKGIQTDNESCENRINCGFVNVSISGLHKYFNLQCFYCDAEYPITFWSEFSEHILDKHGYLEKVYEKSDSLETTINEHKVCDNMDITYNAIDEENDEEETGEEMSPIHFINLDDIEDNDKNIPNITTSTEISFDHSDSNDRSSEQYLYVNKYVPSIEHSYCKYNLQNKLWPKENEAIKENEPLNELPTQPTKDTYKCFECEENFTCANEYKMHLDIHPKGNCPYACEECGKRFKSEILRKKHQVKHKSNGYKCEICSLELASAISFKNHMDGHKGIYEYICEWCGRAFVCRKYWREHCQYEHLGYGICQICNREYKKRTILYKHLRTLHRPTFGTVEQLSKPCRKRGKRSKVNLKLRKHEYILDPVTQTQRLKCPKCDKSFRRHRNLRLHATKIHNYDIRDRPRGNTQTPQIPQKREKSQLFKHCWIRASKSGMTVSDESTDGNDVIDVRH